MNSYIKQGDCLELMQEIPDKSIDLILCDLPYGVTACGWDKKLPLDKLWVEYKRIVKKNSAIILFAKDKFSAEILMSNVKGFKHKWFWNKKQSGSFFLAKYMPLQIVEEVLVFTSNGEKVNYFPQMVKGKMRKRGGAKKAHSSMRKGFNDGYFSKSDLYNPINILEFASIKKNRLHPTEKPVELLEYLIKTYSNENDIVLDNCMGSGSTAIACIRTNRKYIGYELEKEYFDIAIKRIENEIKIKRI